MSYPGGYGDRPGPGQPGPAGGPAFGQPPAPPNPFAKLGLTGVLMLVVLALSLVVYFITFGGGGGIGSALLLAGGLLAAMVLLPRAPRVLPFAVLLTVVGALGQLAGVIAAPVNATSDILVMVFGLLQAIVAVGALLVEFGVVKPPPRPAVPHNYGGPGTFSPPPSTPPPGPPSTPFPQQPGQFGPPPGRP